LSFGGTGDWRVRGERPNDAVRHFNRLRGAAGQQGWVDPRNDFVERQGNLTRIIFGGTVKKSGEGGAKFTEGGFDRTEGEL
jgi:hypothetical protein